MNVIDCECAVWALTNRDDWQAIENGNHHPGCPKGSKYRIASAIYLAEGVMGLHPEGSPLHDLAASFLEILQDKE